MNLNWKNSKSYKKKGKKKELLSKALNLIAGVGLVDTRT